MRNPSLTHVRNVLPYGFPLLSLIFAHSFSISRSCSTIISLSHYLLLPHFLIHNGNSYTTACVKKDPSGPSNTTYGGWCLGMATHRPSGPLFFVVLRLELTKCNRYVMYASVLVYVGCILYVCYAYITYINISNRINYICKTLQKLYTLFLSLIVFHRSLFFFIDYKR